MAGAAAALGLAAGESGTSVRSSSGASTAPTLAPRSAPARAAHGDRTPAPGGADRGATHAPEPTPATPTARAPRAGAHPAASPRSAPAERRTGRHWIESGGRRVAPIELAPAVAIGAMAWVGGLDPLAPRAVSLWRVEGGRAARIADGRSRPDGTLDLPPLALPAGEVELVATPRRGRPAGPGASSPIRVRREPVAPHLEAEPLGGGRVRLRVEPAETGGEIVLARVADPALLVPEAAAWARGAVSAESGSPGAALEWDVEIGAEADGAWVLAAQRLPDGRSSPWQRLRIGVFADEEEQDGPLELE